jgi:hypothetical protein
MPFRLVEPDLNVHHCLNVLEIMGKYMTSSSPTGGPPAPCGRRIFRGLSRFQAKLRCLPRHLHKH